MKQISRLTAAAALSTLSLALAGCLGKDDDSANNGSSASSVTISPSLGVVTNATVNVYQADGATLLGTGELGSAGQVTINIPDYSGPVVIEVAGDSNAQYYDEATGALVSLPAGKKIRAMASSASGTFAVTVLTELAYQGAVAQNLLPLDANEVDAMNEKIRAALASEIGNLLTPPTAFNATTTAGSLGNDDAGRHALKLAALASLGNGQAAPALAVLESLVADLADGAIDGNGSGGASVNAPYSNFASQLTAAVGTMAANFGAAALQTAAGGFAAPTTSIDFKYSSGGSSTNLTCNTALFASGAPVVTPTGLDFIFYAGAYTGEEGSFDMNFNFVKSGTAALTLSVAGVLGYKGQEYSLTSACVETLAGGTKQLVLHTAKGHFDFGSDKTTVTGVSPVDGTTAFRTVTSGGTNGGTTGGSSSGLSIPTGKTISSASASISYTAMPNVGPTAKIITWISDTTRVSVYDYIDTLGIGVSDSNPLLSIGVTPANACALKSASINASTPACSSVGVAFDRTAGSVNFTNTPMHPIISSCPGDCTINGSLSFTPY